MEKKGMKLFEQYSRIIGFLLLTFVIILLFSTPSMILARSITTIDTELSRASGSETPVRAKMDFGSTEHMRTFPMQIGDWKGYDYSARGLEKSLHADVILMRAYSNPEFYLPVFFLIVQSDNRSSFHPPIVCYPALGYTIEEVGKEKIPVHNIGWIEEPLYGYGTGTGKDNESIPFDQTITISAKKLIVVKESDGKITERRVVLYFYVKEKLASNKVTMIRVSALAPLKGSYDGILNLTKDFMSDTIPYMFELREEEPNLLILLTSDSVIGKVTIGLLFLTPLMIIFYPEIRNILKRYDYIWEDRAKGKEVRK